MENMPNHSWMYRERGPGIKGLTNCERTSFTVGIRALLYNWRAHGENLRQHDEERILAERVVSPQCDIVVESSRSLPTENNSYCEMIFHAVGLKILPQNEPHNPEAKKFFDMLKAMETPAAPMMHAHRHLQAMEVLFLCLLPLSRLHHFAPSMMQDLSAPASTRGPLSLLSPTQATPSPAPPVTQDPSITSQSTPDIGPSTWRPPPGDSP
ncbi:hypothetical protein M9H77_08071 [Catharanthus roseus]|uniref:Uncharacterized protein n=1 Tax=Catharanthus roseus TaxID=4058 RepID=A0ACC0BWV0_CATRO|nr:hypothetical protein M9H77_08071 [Catharanthus roseus]